MGGYEETIQAEVVEGKELAYPNIALGCPWRSAVLTIHISRIHHDRKPGTLVYLL